MRHFARSFEARTEVRIRHGAEVAVSVYEGLNRGVGRGGFEPPTIGLKGRCSTRLS